MGKPKPLTEAQLAAFSPWPLPAADIRAPGESPTFAWEFDEEGVRACFSKLGIAAGQCAAIVGAAELRDRFVSIFQYSGSFDGIAVRFVPVVGGIGDEWMAVAQRGRAIYNAGDV